jgi:hypothetical protein
LYAALSATDYTRSQKLNIPSDGKSREAQFNPVMSAANAAAANIAASISKETEIDRMIPVDTHRHPEEKASTEINQRAVPSGDGGSSSSPIDQLLGMDTVLLVVCSNRPEYLRTSLEHVVKYHPK